MLEVIPAILTNDPRELEEKVRLIESITNEEGARFVSRVHVDIIDGQFTEGRTVSLEVFGEVETSLLVDVHLMVVEPVKWIERAVGSMADRVIGQIERMGNQEEFVNRATEARMKVGLAFDIQTPVSDVDPVALNGVDLVLVMGRKAGWEEQAFDEAAVEKIRELNAIRVSDATPFMILVDGGVNGDNIGKLVEVGADEVVVGHALFTGDLLDNLIELQSIAFQSNG